jgi:hypothetical protein
MPTLAMRTLRGANPQGKMMENPERSILSRVPLSALILLAGGAFLYVVYLMTK